MAYSQEVTVACCDDATAPCVAGLPTTCSDACADVLLPMQRACNDFGDDWDAANDQYSSCDVWRQSLAGVFTIIFEYNLQLCY